MFITNGYSFNKVWKILLNNIKSEMKKENKGNYKNVIIK